MILAFNQPAFIPWGGFFARMLKCDRFILLDDTLLARGFTFVNRNRIKGPEGIRWVRVPVVRAHGRRQRINRLVIHEKDVWGNKWLRTLHHTYGHAGRYAAAAALFDRALTASKGSFVDFVEEITGFMASELGIATKCQRQSTLGIRLPGDRLLEALVDRLSADGVVLPFHARSAVNWKRLAARGIEVSFLRFVSRPYPQFWGTFAPNLSALDTILCTGSDARRIIEDGIRIQPALAGDGHG